MIAETWRLLDAGWGEPAENMAIDELLLEEVGLEGKPVLRYYGWKQPAATFGYSQRFSDVSRWETLRPLIRRPTGGGLVSHGKDWTYSVVIPPGHYWYGLRAEASYRRMHEWICAALNRVGMPSLLAPDAVKSVPGQCFSGAERFDLVFQERKIAGAAQRRSKAGLLIQGSLQVANPKIVRESWQEAMLECYPGVGISWEAMCLDDRFKERAAGLVREKYSTTWYNQRR